MSIPAPEPCIEDPKQETADSTKSAHGLDMYSDMFTTFPKEKGWITKNMYFYQGHWYSSKHLFALTTMALQDTFQTNPTDIYVVTQPKSGTTWIKALTFAIVNRTKYENNSLSTHPLLVSNPHDLIRFIENDLTRTTLTYIDGNSPRVFASHMPYPALPRSIIDCGSRLVYMCRNPKDVLVSLFYFANKLRDKSIGLLTVKDAFEMFSKGVTPCGPYWDNVKEYYEASLEHPTRILFLIYDNMKLDTENTVKRLAEFLGYPFTKEEEAKGVVQEIISLCSFKNLKEVNKNGNIHDGVPAEAFFRKGEVGDWSNHLTIEMSQVLDQITLEKFRGLDISF